MKWFVYVDFVCAKHTCTECVATCPEAHMRRFVTFGKLFTAC